MVNTKQEIKINQVSKKTSIHHLTFDQVKMIEEAITSVGEFGEVRLVIERGTVHYLVTQKSINMRKHET
jgi:hypothetical protein